MAQGNVNGQQITSSPSQNSPNSVQQNYTAQDVADAFLKQYYNILKESPQDSHKFYNENSLLAYPCPDGSMKSATTLKGIDEVIMGSKIKEWNPNLTTVHAQDTVMGSVVVGVTGFLTDNENVKKHFAQTFVLTPQEGGGFYVYNDFLQFIEIVKIDDVASPEITVDKAKEDEKKVAEKKNQSPKTPEDTKRVSYASIVAKEGAPVATTPQTSPNPKALPKSSVNSVKPLILPSNDVLEKTYDIKSIRIKDLPAKMTQDSLHEAVKRFGPVKTKNVQIKQYSEDGYRYAFVEFDNPKSARNAVEARFIQFGERESEIQYKRLYNQGGHNNYTGRGGSGTGYGRGGGFRNDNFWGREREGEWRSGGGNWGGRYNEHDNYGRRYGNRNFQDPPRSF